MKQLHLLYFSDVFRVSRQALDEWGAFNISLVTDLPLFIDPFLLFSSEKSEYQELHEKMIDYLRFLRDKSESGVEKALLRAWYYFGEVKQNWLGFCESGNRGRGLGKDFAWALNENLARIFTSFGKERVTRSSHIEKLCLIGPGVGRDMISDFTTNLIKEFLCSYTERFAQRYIDSRLTRRVRVDRATFDCALEAWVRREHVLPWFQDDYVLLTPRDILTRDDTWISRSDMISSFASIPLAIEDEILRAQVDNYFRAAIPRDREPTGRDYWKAAEATFRAHPGLVDYYIRMKEETADKAAAISEEKVGESHALYVEQFGKLAALLHEYTEFYAVRGTTKDETRQRIEYLKHVVENKGGHRIFYLDGEPVRREQDLHILFMLTWFCTPSDVSHEVNDGRGPADFKISRGAFDKTIVEFKLASNPQLRRNLERQVGIYMKASDSEAGFRVIIYFTARELSKVQDILRELGLDGDPNIYLIDARSDNKPSASKA